MQATTGQKALWIPALLLLSLVTSVRASVEKMSTPRAGFSTARTSCGSMQPCFAHPRTARICTARTAKATAAKTLMIASWYGEKFQGRLTSSGERFDLNKLTAASRTLPIGSRIMLTAPSTGRSVVVKINDRGPRLKGRDLDLSEAAALKLGIHEKGIAKVEVALLK